MPPVSHGRGRAVSLGQAARNFKLTHCLGVIIIEPVGSQALIGTEFLKKFNLTLVTDPANNTIGLFPSDSADAIAAAQSKTP